MSSSRDGIGVGAMDDDEMGEAPSTEQPNRRRHPPLKQSDYRVRVPQNIKGYQITSNDVATLPRPGTSSPTNLVFHHAPTTSQGEQQMDSAWITYLAPDLKETQISLTRKLYATHVTSGETVQLFPPPNEDENDAGEESYSLEEKLRRERLRLYSTGVTSYSSAKRTLQNETSTTVLLIPMGGALWLLEQSSINAPKSVRKLIETRTTNKTNDDDANAHLPLNAPLLDATLSTANGEIMAFCAQDEVYVMETNDPNARPRQVTNGARDVEGRTNGVADYLAQEELERAEGFWLSPRGKRLIFESVDESLVAPYRMTHQGDESTGLSSTTSATMTTPPNKNASLGSFQLMAESSKVPIEEHLFPFAGGLNPIVELGVVSTNRSVDDYDQNEDEGVIWFDLTDIFGDDFYLAKVKWLPPPTNDENTEEEQDSTQCVVQLLDRKQQNLALLLLDCETGQITVLHKEKAVEGGWINLHNCFSVIESDDENLFRFLWASERDGYRHLYIMESDLTAGNEEAGIVQRLTGPGEFIVDSLLRVDQDNQMVYYMGTNPDGWLDKHMFRVQYGKNITSPECLTGSVPGQHSCVVDFASGLYVDTVSNLTHAPLTTIKTLSNNDVGILYDAATRDDRVPQMKSVLAPPTLHTFPSTDGKVTLQAALYLPDAAIHGPGPYPMVVATYGGPHVQYVSNSWNTMTADLRSQFLRQNGFCVLKVDNRGSDRRGLVFEMPIFGRMGTVEVEDQVAGVTWAINEGHADKDRVAVSGWSYGGYMALKCLFDRPSVFGCAISGAPVTDWRLYDSAYTERYMGLPQENAAGYQTSAALNGVKDLMGSLLLCHGLLDENVLFRHSAVLIQELIRNEKVYDLILFPSERHGPRRVEDRAYLEERVVAFLQRSLGV